MYLDNLVLLVLFQVIIKDLANNLLVDPIN